MFTASRPRRFRTTGQRGGARVVRCDHTRRPNERMAGASELGDLGRLHGMSSRPARAAPPRGWGRGRSGAHYRRVVPSESRTRRELEATLAPEPVVATARTSRWPLRLARRWTPVGSFTFSVFEAPGARSNRTLPSCRTALSPPSLTAFAVRTVREPVQFDDDVAGQLTLNDATPLITFAERIAMVTGRRRGGAPGGGGTAGVATTSVRSTVSNPARMSSSAPSATTESLPSP